MVQGMSAHSTALAAALECYDRPATMLAAAAASDTAAAAAAAAAAQKPSPISSSSCHPKQAVEAQRNSTC
jgi:hypothetical protein